MKIIKLKYSLLFLRIDPVNDSVKCFFWFFISWNCFKKDKRVFELKTLSVSQVVTFYSSLSNDWILKYKIRNTNLYLFEIKQKINLK